MPATSKAQQRFMGIVHGLQKGTTKPSDVSGAAKKAAKSMKKKSAKDFAKTKHKGLPNKVKEALLSENPAASAAAAMVMMQMQNPDTGKKVKAITPLRNKDHKLHSKAKGIFKRLKDKFSKKKSQGTVHNYLRGEEVEEGFGGDLKDSDKQKFEKARKENAEQLGYELTGVTDIKEGKFSSVPTKKLVKTYKQMADERLSGSSALTFRLIAKELIKRKAKLESVNEADLKSQMKAEMDKVKKHRETMRKHSGKDKDKADRALARMKAAQARVDKLQDKIIGIKRETVDEDRDYKAEYKKYGSSTKAKKYRAELNQYNRKKGTYGNGDGKDASHKGGKIVGFEKESTNRGRAEKSRLKKESVNEGKVEPKVKAQLNVLAKRLTDLKRADTQLEKSMWEAIVVYTKIYNMVKDGKYFETGGFKQIPGSLELDHKRFSQKFSKQLDGIIKSTKDSVKRLKLKESVNEAKILTDKEWKKAHDIFIRNKFFPTMQRNFEKAIKNKDNHNFRTAIESVIRYMRGAPKSQLKMKIKESVNEAASFGAQVLLGGLAAVVKKAGMRPKTAKMMGGGFKVSKRDKVGFKMDVEIRGFDKKKTFKLQFELERGMLYVIIKNKPVKLGKYTMVAHTAQNLKKVGAALIGDK